MEQSHDSIERPPRRGNNVVSPPKPPRKAPSQSPPSMRRGNEHYARPVADAGTGRSSKMVSSMMEQLSQGGNSTALMSFGLPDTMQKPCKQVLLPVGIDRFNWYQY